MFTTSAYRYSRKNIVTIKFESNTGYNKSAYVTTIDDTTYITSAISYIVA